MKPDTPNPHNLLRKYGLVLAGWSVLVVASLAWNLHHEGRNTLNSASAAARASVNKDIIFRKWVASHGGVYVPPSERTPPNPYLNLPDRDVVTTTGKPLTLMNPAYALREMQANFSDEYGTQSHITSLKPLNPRNSADAWETVALTQFERGSKEFQEVQQIDGQPYLRMMQPFVVESGCLKCHAQQGYKLGDIRGGISTSVPLKAYLAHERERGAELALSHSAIWLIGLAGLGFSYRRERRLDIESEKLANALRESEKRFRTIADAAPIMIWMSGTDKLCHFFNKGWLEFTGRSMEQEVGNGWSDGVHPDDLKGCLDTYVEAFDARREFRVEYRLRRHDGEYRWLVDNGVPRFDSAGTFLGYIGNCVDITERKKAEEKINELNRDFVSFLENTSDFIYFKDQHSRIRFCSQTLADITGHASWRDMIGKNDLEIFPKDTAQIYYEEELPIFNEGKPLLNKIDPYYDASGNKGWVSTNKWPLFDHRGKVVGLFGISRDISALKKAEDALRESEARFRTMANSAPVLIWVTKVDRLCSWVNKVWLEFTGRSLEQEIGNGWMEAIHPEDSQRCLGTYVAAFDAQQEFSMEYRLRQFNGEYRWFVNHGVPRYDDQGTFMGYIGSCFDITGRKQIEEYLRESESRYKRITEGIADYQYTVRIENGHAVETRQSPACVTITGYTAEEFSANPYLWIQMVAPEDRDLVRQHVQQILSGKDVPPIEHRIVRKDGQIRWVSDTTILFRDASGSLVSYDGVISDITGRKVVEQELLGSERSLNEAQRIAHVGSWDWDVASGASHWSDEECRIFGYEPGMVKPSYDLFFQALHPEDRARVRAALDAALDGNVPYSIECRILLPDGTLKHIHCLAEVERDAAGKPKRMFGTVRDITEHKRVEIALGQSEARYRSLVSSSPMCIHEIDMEGRIASMNKAGLLMMDAKYESDVRGLLYLDAVCVTDRERIGELLAKAYAGETSYFEFRSSGSSDRIFKSCFVPIRDKDGKVEKLMGITEDITERKQVEEKIRSLAFYDALTQLPNRRMLNDRLGQAMAASKRSGLYGALMFLDLDNFKPLNDTYGHEVGDLLLVEVARRLTGCVREMDTVARFGGDEFVVMLGELDMDKAESVTQAGIVAEKIRATLAEPYLLARKQEGHAEITIEHHCTSSIGVVLFIDHEASPEDIIKWADMAMYQAKDGGRNRYHFYRAV